MRKRELLRFNDLLAKEMALVLGETVSAAVLESDDLVMAGFSEGFIPNDNLDRLVLSVEDRALTVIDGVTASIRDGNISASAGECPQVLSRILSDQTPELLEAISLLKAEEVSDDAVASQLRLLPDANRFILEEKHVGDTFSVVFDANGRVVFESKLHAYLSTTSNGLFRRRVISHSPTLTLPRAESTSKPLLTPLKPGFTAITMSDGVWDNYGLQELGQILSSDDFVKAVFKIRNNLRHRIEKVMKPSSAQIRGLRVLRALGLIGPYGNTQPDDFSLGAVRLK